MSTDSTNQHETSKVSAIKDQAIGAVKQAIGSVLGNNKMEVEGKAQKLQGKNEYQHAKASKNETTENPHGYDPQAYQQQSFPDPAQPEPLAPTAVQGPPPPAPGHSVNPSGQDQGYNQTYPTQAVPPPPPPSQDQAYNQTNNQNWTPSGQDPAYYQNNQAVPPPPPPSQDQAYNQCPPPAPPTQQNNNNFSNQGDPSQMAGWKDQAVGSIKQTYGNATGNTNAELEGKAQQMHGKNEAEFAKAQKQGLNEPEHYAQGTKTTEPVPDAKGEVEDQSVSTLGAIKDKAMGSMKEMYGSMTGNQDMELKGKAQNIHGKNEAEFVKAQKQGLAEPEHFSHGTKTTDHAQGQVEGDHVSSLSAMKDQAIGSVKESFGSATGNTNAELEGKAQQMHGKNEAEFAKAQKQGLNEPEHYAQGTKTTDHAQGQIVGEQPSKMSGWKDQAVGSVKESVGSATNNQGLEIEGKAQKFQGSNECAFAEAQKNPNNA